MPVNVLTQRNAPDRRGINRDEQVLHPGNVDYAQFGRVGTYPVAGSVYAQPLYVSGVDCGPHGIRNLLIVATMENEVYAFDADKAGAAAQIWPAGESGGLKLGASVDSSLFDRNYTDFYRKPIGVLSTPTIETAAATPARGTIYLVSFQFDAAAFAASGRVATPSMFTYALHALDLGSGRILRQATIAGRYPGGGYAITDSLAKLDPGLRLNIDHVRQTASMTIDFAGKPVVVVDATGVGGPQPMVHFNAMMQLQRPGLLLQDGALLIAFGSRGDEDPYHGWVFSYDAATLKQTGIFCTTPNGVRGGIWQAGQGLVQDSKKNIYASTGNGDNDHPGTGPVLLGRNFGQSFLGLRRDGSGLRLNGWFTMFSDIGQIPLPERATDRLDDDFGAGAPALLPDDRIVAGGKDGWFFLIDPDQLDKLGSADAVPQAFKASFNIARGSRVGTVPNDTSRHIHGSPVVWAAPGGEVFVYVWGENDVVRVYQYMPETGADPRTGRFPDQPGDFRFGSVPGQGVDFARGDVYASNELAARNGMSGGFLSLSTNGDKPGTGILWAAYPPFGNANNADVDGALVAYDASGFDVNLAYKRLPMLWNSRQTPGDAVGHHVKFCCPTVANGRVYLATGSGQVAIYGLRGKPVVPKLEFSGGRSGLALNGSASLAAAGTVILTEPPKGQGNPTFLAASVFTRDMVDIRRFQCSFTVKLTAPDADGFTFTIQAEGPHAIGSSGSGLGYTVDRFAPYAPEMQSTILHSFAVKFTLRDANGGPASNLGLLVNGTQLPGFVDIDLLRTQPGPIDLRGGNPITVRLRYDGNILSTQLTDEQRKISTQDFQLIAGDIPQQINSVTGQAFIGFTGGTGGLSAGQEIVAWSFAPAATS